MHGGFRELNGGWYQVVMEPDDGWQSLQSMPTVSDDLLAAIHQAMEDAHETGFAHGDMRPGNIFVKWYVSGLESTFLLIEYTQTHFEAH